jgi:S1-C subfamily serine protease
MKSRALRCLLLVAAGLAAPGCARLPAEDAEGSPAARIARSGVAAVSDLGGAFRGSAAAVAPDLLVTSAHVVGAVASLGLRRGDGQVETLAVVVQRLEGADLVLLRAEAPVFAAPECLGAAPARDQPVWAVGMPPLGPAVAAGRVLRISARIEGLGTGFTARLPAMIGHSGGPVVDREGCLVGITTALLSPGPATLVGALAGADLAGLLGGQGREVFALGLPMVAALLSGR